MLNSSFESLYPVFPKTADAPKTWWGKLLDWGDMSLHIGGELWKELAPWGINKNTYLIKVSFVPRTMAKAQNGQDLHFTPVNSMHETLSYAFPDDPLGRFLIETDGSVNLNLWWVEGWDDLSTYVREKYDEGKAVSVPENAHNPFMTTETDKQTVDDAGRHMVSRPIMEQFPDVGQLPASLTSIDGRVGELSVSEKAGRVLGLNGRWYRFQNANYKKREFISHHGRRVAIEYDQLVYLKQALSKDTDNREILILDTTVPYFKPLYSVNTKGLAALEKGATVDKLRQYMLSEVLNIETYTRKDGRTFTHVMSRVRESGAGSRVSKSLTELPWSKNLQHLYFDDKGQPTAPEQEDIEKSQTPDQLDQEGRINSTGAGCR